MAERRMMTKKIIHSDAFLDMPSSTQNLYFHLLLEADDEGFVNSPKRVQRTIGAGDDDAKILLAKKFIIGFDSGVIVIKHWRMHNYIQNDRFKGTTHTEEKAKIRVKSNNVYTLDTNCTPSIGEVSIGEVSIVKDNIVEEIVNHLNDVLNKNYKHTGQKIKSLINARLKEGFTLEDFQKVHIVKFSEWNGTEMQKYLRPETLYGTKFESYLNQELSEYEKAKVICKMKGITMQELMLEGEER